MSIRVSQKHGVNPSLSICFFCGKDKNEIILVGRLREDAEAPHRAVWNKEPCDECKKYMAMGVMLISVKDGTDHENPYRTGAIAVITVEAAQRIFGDAIGKSRIAFLEDTAWNKVKLPR